MKILIVGAGMGGLALAAFLKKFDLDFDIVEKSANWKRQGYSLGMWDNGRDILKKLGLEEKFDKFGEQIKEFVICNGNGQVIRNYNLGDFYLKYGSAYTHIDRNLLHSWLLELAGANKIKLNTPLQNLDQTNSYDVVVGADGVHSQVRNLIFSDNDYEHYSQWRAWFIRIDNKFRRPKSVVQYMEAGQFISIFDDKNQTLAVFIAPADHSQHDEEKGRVTRLIKVFNRHSQVTKMLKDIKDSQITATNLSFVDITKWVKGKFVLLGDAAHAMEPFAGLGASMALEDAYVLAGELIKAKNGERSLQEALGYYEKSRQKRVRFAKNATANMRWWAINKSPNFFRMIRLIGPYFPVNHFTADFHQLLKQEI